MSIISQLRLLYLCHFSRPAADRAVYRIIRRCRAHKIVELGIGDAGRAVRMIEVARHSAVASDIHYVGMDLFEGQAPSSGPNISLKAAHQLLRSTGARVQLVPGNPCDGLIRLANSLGKVDLLILPAELDSPPFARVWSFVPRMLHQRSMVFLQGVADDGQPTLLLKPWHEIDRMATGHANRRAA